MPTGARIYQWGTFSSFANLASGTTPLDGDKAQVVMGGRSTQWQYDGTLSVWRIQEPFVTTSSVLNANTILAGMQNGDRALATDTGQTAFWNSSQGSYTYVS